MKESIHFERVTNIRELVISTLFGVVGWGGGGGGIVEHTTYQLQLQFYLLLDKRKYKWSLPAVELALAS